MKDCKVGSLKNQLYSKGEKSLQKGDNPETFE